MTKTTSYEISKQLKEAGFEAETDYNFIERNNQKVFLRNIKELTDIELMNEIGVFIKSYDLETLLDALPNTTEIIISNYTGKRIFYLNSNIRGNEVSIAIEENESLADAAGRMWLELKEKNLL